MAGGCALRSSPVQAGPIGLRIDTRSIAFGAADTDTDTDTDTEAEAAKAEWVDLSVVAREVQGRFKLQLSGLPAS